jgi:imidazolonepropionase-like amidohydrolase
MKRLLSLLLVIVIHLSAIAQQTFPVNGTTDPKHIVYAFTHATIFTDYKSNLTDATLVILDGKIVDIGNHINIPDGAVTYDLKGKLIYPSLVDIFSDYGLPEVKPATPSENPQLLSNTKGAYNWNQSVKAEYDAYKNFNADPKKAEELRKLGFGTVMCVNRDGIIRGTSVLVLLSNGKENDLVLKDRAAANFSFDPGSSTQDYPGSQMGAIALIRQTYYDAQWYKDGGYKREFNISLDAFNNLKSLPHIFETGEKQEDLRVKKIGDEFNERFIIKGAGDEYERIDDIKASGSSFIIPLNFPEAFDLSDPYETVNLNLRQLKEWELAPVNAGVLASKQIEFAISAADLKNKNDFWKNLRKAIDNGLNSQDALKAITFTPANMLGVADEIGQLKKGSLANFIITTKTLFDKDNVILENWVNGRQYKISDAPSKDLRGHYTLQIKNQKGFHLKIGGELLSPDAVIYEDSSASKINFSRQGSVYNFQFELKKNEPKGVYRLTGSFIDSVNASGNVLMPSGEWSKWTAHLDSAFLTPAPKQDSVKNEQPGKTFYPNMAYGWRELPVAKSFVIRNATIWTNEQEGILQNADVYVEGGKIKKVGKNLTVPDGTESIDGTSKHVTSGIIDEHSHIAISGNVNEATQASSAEVRIGDIIDADDIQIYRQLAGGVTVSHLLHGSANPIGGQTQIIKLRWGLPPEKLKFENAPQFIKFALGENVKQSHWGDKQVIRYPQTRMGVEQVYRDFFTRAKEYAQQMHEYMNEDPKIRAGKIPVRRQLELDALEEIMENKRFITCHSYQQGEINMLMHVADSFGFRINTFTHILEGYKVADKMKAHGVSGASTFSDWWAYKYEVIEAIPYNGAIMQKLGLNVGFNSDNSEMARRLNQEAAKSVKYGGVKEEDAWKFVTLNPAKMLHIDDRVGSLKIGKDADIVLWNDNPLSIYARPLQTYIDGIRYYDVQRDSLLRMEIKSERSRIMKKMVDAKNKGESVKKPGMNYQEIKHCDGSDFIYIK